MPDRKSLTSALRAEAERDADDAGAGEERGDVDAELGRGSCTNATPKIDDAS